jgi:hypothetical protein
MPIKFILRYKVIVLVDMITSISRHERNAIITSHIQPRCLWRKPCKNVGWLEQLKISTQHFPSYCIILKAQLTSKELICTERK